MGDIPMVGKPPKGIGIINSTNGIAETGNICEIG